MAMSNKRIEGIDELRGLLALGIIMFHYFALGKYYGTWATHNALSDWGTIIVYLFFIVSGICLYKSNSNIKPSQFFYKRWKALFPTFYVAWILVYILRLITTGSLNPDNASLSTIPLTIAGVDGYFLYLGKNFYLIGEWFLGAIILLYLLYPLYLKLVKLSSLGLLAVLALLTVLTAYTDLFEIINSRNLICCSTGFVIGMCLGKNEKPLEYKAIIVLSAFLSCTLLVFNLKQSIPEIILVLVCSTTLFISLRYLFSKVGGGGVFLTSSNI